MIKRIVSIIRQYLIKPVIRILFIPFVIKPIQRHLYNTPFLYGQGRILVGRNVGLGNAILNARSGNIVIGDNVSLGHNAMLLTGYHDMNAKNRKRPTLEDAKRDIEIGDSVWIASGAIVIGPVKIGKNSIVGAGSVVTEDIPEGVLVAGNPAREIRKL